MKKFAFSYVIEKEWWWFNTDKQRHWLLIITGDDWLNALNRWIKEIKKDNPEWYIISKLITEVK